jgi:hypothetical protein
MGTDAFPASVLPRVAAPASLGFGKHVRERLKRSRLRHGGALPVRSHCWLRGFAVPWFQELWLNERLLPLHTVIQVHPDNGHEMTVDGQFLVMHLLPGTHELLEHLAVHPADIVVRRARRARYLLQSV